LNVEVVLGNIASDLLSLGEPICKLVAGPTYSRGDSSTSVKSLLRFVCIKGAPPPGLPHLKIKNA